MFFIRKNKSKINQLKNKEILLTTGEGCQGYHKFHWIGKVVGFDGHDILIKIQIRNGEYSDIRDDKFMNEIYKYPLNGNIQNVDGMWVIFN